MSTYAHKLHGLGRSPATRAPGAMSVRFAALGGVAYFGLILAFLSQLEGTPKATDSSRQVFNYLSAHHGGLQAAAVLIGFAMPAALLFLSGLFRALREAEGGTARLALAALGGGILAAAAGATGALILGTTAASINDLGPASAHVWWTMYLMSIGATLLGLLLAIGVTAIISLQRRLFARWFALASVALALLSIAGAFTIGYATTATYDLSGAAIVLDSIWIFLVSLFLWRDPTLALPGT
jgi:hypothetical protein